MSLALLLSLLPAQPADAEETRRVRVVSVYDGDTLTLDGGDKIRLNHANAPEIKGDQPYATQARDLARRLAEGEFVDLTAEGGTDSYGRTVGSIGTSEGDLALALIREGYAHVFLIPPVGDTTALVAAQAEARAARRGIWSTERYQGSLYITSFHANGRGDDRAYVNGEYLRVCNVTDAPVDLAGYSVQGSHTQVFPLPSLVVPPGHTVEIRSGEGVARTDPSSQLVVHLGSDLPLWDDQREEVTIRDSSGTLVDRASHPPR